MSLLRICLLLPLAFFFQHSMAQEINWMTWEEAVIANKAAPKKMFVDVYTEWCGWCKKMDKTTFTDSAVVARLNADFYPIKLNAEQKESIFWNDKEYKWVEHKRDGIHQLAFELLEGRLSYPTYILMDSSFARILISPGYMVSEDLIRELRYASENHYKSMSWPEFKSKS